MERFRYPGSPTVIPIAVHIVRHSDGSADVPNAQIQDQLDVLNAAYLDSGFQFTLLSIDRTDNTAWSTHEEGSAEEAAMKNALAVDSETTLNVYLCDLADGLLGYATFSWVTSSMEGLILLVQQCFVRALDAKKTTTRSTGALH